MLVAKHRAVYSDSALKQWLSRREIALVLRERARGLVSDGVR